MSNSKVKTFLIANACRVWRAPILLCMVVIACLLTVLFGKSSATLQTQIRRRWSRHLLNLLGIKLVVRATQNQATKNEVKQDNEVVASFMETRGLRIANHISWADSFLLDAISPSIFIAKQDIAGWPLLGWLAKAHDTYFISQGSAQHLRSNLRELETLLSDHAVTLFPEGTTSDGKALLPFYPAFFELVRKENLPILPCLIQYKLPSGQRNEAFAFVGEMTLLSSLYHVLGVPKTQAIITILEPVYADHRSRKDLAKILHKTLEDQLHVNA